MTITLSIVGVALLAIWGFGKYNVSRLERDVAAMRQQQAAQQHLGETAGGLINAYASPETRAANIKQLSLQLAERTRALDLLRSGGP